jgi:hypothetical protein
VLTDWLTQHWHQQKWIGYCLGYKKTAKDCKVLAALKLAVDGLRHSTDHVCVFDRSLKHVEAAKPAARDP